MYAVATVNVVLLLAFGGVCSGATFRPFSFTYTGVSSINGSYSNAGCPLNCRMTASSEKFCDCTGVFSDTPGVLIDGIPTINVNERGTWASQLYTADVTASSYAIGFRFISPIILQEIEVHLFFCPAWGIPTSSDLTINIQRSISFLQLVAPTLVGTVTLTGENLNCDSPIRVSITTQTPARTIYFIEFMSTTTLGGIYIGEVIFRDEVEAFIEDNSGSSIPQIRVESDATSILPLPTTSTTSLHTSIKPFSTLSSVTTNMRSQETTSSTSLIRETTSALQSDIGQTTDSVTGTSITTTSSIIDANTTTLIDHNIQTISPPSTSNILVAIVAAFIIVVLFMAIIIIVGGTICLVIVIKSKRSVSAANNRQQEQNTDGCYEYITDFNVTVRHGDNTGDKQQVTTDSIELMINSAYDTMKNIKDIKN